MEPHKPERVTQAEMARRLKVTRSAIAKAVAGGRMTVFDDGMLDPAVAAIQWQANRRRRPRMSPPAPGAAPAQAADAGAFWAAKTEREVAEARMATMREREMAGELVRRDDITQEFGTRLVTLRTALENLSARLAPMLVAETDQARCQRLLRDEHRAALNQFLDDVPQEVESES